MNMKKRGQITVFIIIAIVLLFSSALFFYFRTYRAEEDLNVNFPVVTQVPLSLQPLDNFVSRCASQAAQKAIVQLGLHGGWVDVNSPRFEQPSGSSPGNLVEAVDGVFVPYWIFHKNGLPTIENVPLLYKEAPADYSVQSQIERYVNAHIGECLEGFESMEAQGFEVEELGTISSRVDITEQNVVVNLDYPLKVTRQGETNDLNFFRGEVNVKLKKVYQLAADILYKEANDVIFERAVLDSIMVGYEGKTPEELPPRHYGLVTEGCNEKTRWNMAQVVDNFQYMLTDNIPYMRINHTDYERLRVLQTEEYDDFLRAAQNNFFTGMILNITEDQYSEFAVDFEAKPLLAFGINGLWGRSGILEPPVSVDSGNPFSDECLTTYRFQYSFAFPLIVTIYDQQEGQEYLFQFPILVVVADNWPRISETGDLALETDDEVPSPVPGLLDCDPGQPQTPPIQITLKNSLLPNNKISGATVEYQCTPNAGICNIGYSEANSKVLGKFPICSNGLVMLRHPQFMGANYLFNSEQFEDQEGIEIEYTMVPLKEYDIKAQIYDTTYLTLPGDDASCELSGPAADMHAGQKLSELKVTRLTADENTWEDVVRDFRPGSAGKLRLAPGKYLIEAQLYLEFPEDSPHTYFADSESFGGYTFPPEDVEVSLIMVGGVSAELDVPDNYLDYNTVVVKTTNEGLPAWYSEIGRAADHLEFCMQYSNNKDLLKPQLI
ncbi:hypothetical protein J4227_04890 [Candidatus Woesearchaeota archaeon]|nr:hypothetical protein [Candidatus Woesearchaeota archaeon]